MDTQKLIEVEPVTADGETRTPGELIDRARDAFREARERLAMQEHEALVRQYRELLGAKGSALPALRHNSRERLVDLILDLAVLIPGGFRG